MIVDLQDQLPDLSDIDVCVVGAGAAGITLAVELATSGRKVVILEEGGTSADTAQRQVYRVQPGPTVTLGTAPDRSFYLGGNTNHWYGNCRPLDAEDFAARDWVPHSGWPLKKDELSAHYERAQEICGLGETRWYDIDECSAQWTGPTDVSPLASNVLESRIEQTTPTFSLATVHDDALRRSNNVFVVLGVRVLRLVPDASGAVDGVECVRSDGTPMTVSAARYVLGTGGIENARLLLTSSGLIDGPAADVVGRYFQEHWFYRFDSAVPDTRSVKGRGLQLYCAGEGRELVELEGYRQELGSAHVWAQLVLAPEICAAQGLPEIAIWFKEAGAPAALHALKDSLRNPRELPGAVLGVLRSPITNGAYLLRRVLKRPHPSRRLTMLVQVEQLPDPESRVTLSSSRDSWGVPEAHLETGLDPAQRAGHAVALKLACDVLGPDGEDLARQMERKYRDGEFDYFWHHMGTTRMGEDPATSVVDADCRVHGVPNLYVTGCSVFPTSGTAAPTLTIVALAVRLAAHLAGSAPRP